MLSLGKLSIVIPVYNDEEVLEELQRRLSPVVQELTEKREIIYVDDGSSDRSFEVLKRIDESDPSVVLIKQARNFGQHNSIAAGLRTATGDVVILMDSDLQDRPEDIPKLLEALAEHDCSMAIARWRSREDAWLKRSLSRLFFAISSRLTDVKYPPQLGVFRALSK